MYDTPMKILPEGNVGLYEALDVIRAGGCVAHATETCYGLACDLTNLSAVQKLFRIKRRPQDQPVSALFASVEEAKKWVAWNERAEDLAKKFLPGPLTLILPLRSDAPKKLFVIPNPTPTPNPLPPEALAKGGSVGVRISSHPLAASLVEQCQRPLSTTSANIHGKPNPYSIEEIISQFEGAEFQPDLILDSGTLPPVPPSTVINCMSEQENILRKGTVSTT